MQITSTPVFDLPITAQGVKGPGGMILIPPASLRVLSLPSDDLRNRGAAAQGA